MKNILIILVIGFFITIGYLNIKTFLQEKNVISPSNTEKDNEGYDFSKTPPKPENKPMSIPEQKTLGGIRHVYQTFNNCGPASLSMVLSFYGIYESQETLGNDLRPYQIPNGDNDDKSTSLPELGDKAEEYGFVSFYRPIGDIDLLREFIANDMPVITKTWTKEDEDIGHYRVVKGYNDLGSYIIQDDSLRGKDLDYTYTSFNAIWKKFNFEYLVLVPKEKVKIAEEIIGDNLDYSTAWKNAVTYLESELKNNPSDSNMRFNLSVALYNIGSFEQSVVEFERVQDSIPPRALWYQLEPVQSYFELGNYQKVFEITDEIINNGDRAYSEAYLLRGNIYLKQKKYDLAKEEFEKALYYNINLDSAKDALAKVETQL